MTLPSTGNRAIVQADALAEAAFFTYLVYTMISVTAGMYFPFAATGLLLAALVLAQYSSRFSTLRDTYSILAIGTALTYVLVQLTVHEQPLGGKYVKPIVMWIPMVLALYPLVHRRGFMRRLSWVMMIIILVALPHASLQARGEATQMRFTGGLTGVDNPNDLSFWLGFPALVLWVCAWRDVGKVKTVVSALGAALALLLMLRTAGRGAVLALVVGVCFALSAVRRGRRVAYLIAIGLVVLCFLYVSAFSSIRTNYAARGTGDTGRVGLLETGLGGLWSLPVLGYGAAGGVHIHWVGQSVNTPHNSFILLAFASGWPAFLLFCLLWILAFRRAFRERTFEGRDKLVFLVYALVGAFMSNLSFVSVWAIAACGYAWTETRSLAP